MIFNRSFVWHGAGSGKFGADEAAEDAALRAGAQGVLRQHSRVSAADSEVLARASAIAATAMAERNPDAFAGAMEEASFMSGFAQ
jgi:hypothetical protein